MNRPIRSTCALLSLGVAFLAGVLFAPGERSLLQADAGPDRNLEADPTYGGSSVLALPQDRQPPPPPAGRQNPTTPAPRGTTAPLVYGGDGGSSASANGLLAVTGSYGVGTSVLFLIDTNTKQLAVYEARGGSPNSRRVFLVGARKIDLDMQLEGYNDESEYSYQALSRIFEQQQGRAGTGGRPSIFRSTRTGVAPDSPDAQRSEDANLPRGR